MPNHDVPIEKADVWDILSWDVVSELAKRAPSDPREDGGKYVLEYMANELISAATQVVGRYDQHVLHKIAVPWIGYNQKDAVRRQKASELGARLGARPDRFIEFLAFKWALFQREDLDLSL